MQGITKSAKIITLGGKHWLVGGYWTAGGRYKSKQNLKKAAIAEQFDPGHTAAVWLREAEQIGWFVFDGKPVKERPLAPMVLSKLRMDSVPWRGTFKMEGGWWVVAVDDAMALHPLWDVWVPDNEFQKFVEDNSSRLMTFNQSLQLETSEESQKWLLEGEYYGDSPKATPVIGNEQNIKKGAMALVVAGVVTSIGYEGWRLWQQHEAAVASHQQMLRREQARLNAEAAQKLTSREVHAEEHRIENSWQDWPRPWTNPISWRTFFQTCEQGWSGTVNDQGWMLVQVQCHWTAKRPTVLDIHKTWDRGTFATVLHAPHGVIQKHGDVIIQTIRKSLNWNATGNAVQKPLSSTITENQRFWTGQSQKWNGVIQITQGSSTYYRALIPKNTPPNIRKDLHPPILWRSFPVVFNSIYAPSHWPFWAVSALIPSRMTAVLGKESQYTVTGVQYGR